MPGTALLAALALAAAPTAGFDQEHAAWSRVLASAVDGGSVDYGALHADRRALDAYLGALAAVSPDELGRFTDDQRKAFWINAYNAFTVRLIVDHWPVASIKDVGRIWQSPFRIEFISLAARLEGPISLDTIEHEVLRPKFRDPRIHAAIVCASKGCPALRAEAYRAADLDRQLDDAMRAFLADPAKNSYDPASRTLRLSSIFKWFREDFEAEGGSLVGYVSRFLPAGTAAAIRQAGSVEVEFLDYDWSLNGRATPPASR